MVALAELLTAEHVFEIFEEGFIPLQLTDKKFKTPETGCYTEGVLQLSASPRLQYRNYSNALRFSLTTPETDWKNEDFDRNNRLAFGVKWV
jgi:hypothetical protein